MLGPIKFPSLHLKDQLERSMIKIRANECLLEKFLRVELICIRALLSTVKLSEAYLIFGSDGFDELGSPLCFFLKEKREFCLIVVYGLCFFLQT